VIGFCFVSSCAYAQRGVTLAWDRNTETNIAGYKVHYGTASRAYTSSINVGNVTTASVTNLVAGVTYVFAVTAYNSAGVESDFSAELSHTVTNSVATNLPPTLAVISNLTINEDSGPHSVSLNGITSGGENQTLSVTASATPQSLIPSVQVGYTSPNNTGTLSFATAANSSGNGTVTVTVSDGLAQTTRSFSVIVNPVNDPPTIAALAPATVPAQTVTVLQSVQLTDIDTAALNLAVAGTSSDTNVLPHANILVGTTGLSRTLSVLPLRSGTATVTLRVSDGLAQNAQSFLLTVTNVVATNAPPTLAPITDLAVAEDSGSHSVSLIGIGAGGENQTLIVTAAANPQSLIPSTQVSYTSPGATGLVSFAIAPNATGTGTVTVTVSDGLAQTARLFRVIVNPINDPPTLTTIPDRTILEDTATSPVAFTIGDPDTATANLSLSGTSSDTALVPNANIVFGGSGVNRTVHVTPAPNRSGAASIQVSVSDGALSATRTFQLTVTASNDPPTIAALPAATVPPQTVTALQPVVIADIDTAASNLVVVGTSSDTNVLPHANILVGTTGLSRTLSVQPLRTGVATVTLGVSDGLAQSSQSFLLTVTNTTGLVQMRASYDPAIRGFTISWQSQVGAMYRILSKNSLTEPDWRNVTGNIRATATTTSWADLTAGGPSSAFYIVEMVSPGRTDPP
jgi:hypothetical protein